MYRYNLPRGLIALGLLLTLIGGAVSTVQAQEPTIVVIIARPSEGETIYAGPQTTLYSIAVTGRVVVASGKPQGVQIKLDMIDHDKLVNSRVVQTSADGLFSIPVTVNPEQSASELSGGTTLDRNGLCLTACHYGTDFSFQSGLLLLRITATDANGNRAVDQRHVIVDRAGYARIPVKLVSSQPGQSLDGVPITAATRLYLVRSRIAKATTNADGQADVTVEALAQAPTRYVVQVEPTVVNGQLYQSVQPVEVDLAPNATSAPTVTLTVTARRGAITGRLATKVNTPLAVWAIRVQDGASYRVDTTPQGEFVFSELPIDQYLITADAAVLAEQGLRSQPLKVDLTRTVSADVALSMKPLDGASLRGTVHDTQGAWLPFVWLSIDKTSLSAKTLPTAGAYLLTGLSRTVSTVTTVAPGYYSQSNSVDLTSKSAATLDLALVRRPETRTVRWGDGAIIVPAETDAAVTNDAIAFTQGWLWGQTDSPQPFIINTSAATIALAQGKFALEQLPGQVGWFYLQTGEATITQGSTAIPLKAGQMVMLRDNIRAVPLDPVVIAALGTPGPAPLNPVWEMTPLARVRDGLAQMGIGAAQALTFVTYLLACLVPPVALVWWLRRRSRARTA